MIPVKPVIKCKKAKEAKTCGGRFGLIRNETHAPDGCLANGDNDIHGQKNPHECCGTLPAYFIVGGRGI